MNSDHSNDGAKDVVGDDVSSTPIIIDLIGDDREPSGTKDTEETALAKEGGEDDMEEKDDHVMEIPKSPLSVIVISLDEEEEDTTEVQMQDAEGGENHGQVEIMEEEEAGGEAMDEEVWGIWLEEYESAWDDADEDVWEEDLEEEWSQPLQDDDDVGEEDAEIEEPMEEQVEEEFDEELLRHAQDFVNEMDQEGEGDDDDEEDGGQGWDGAGGENGGDEDHSSGSD